MDTVQQRIADTIRREVRLSVGISEGQEFPCDWLAVAAAVMCAVKASPTPLCYSMDDLEAAHAEGYDRGLADEQRRFQGLSPDRYNPYHSTRRDTRCGQGTL